jgi:rhamnosyltransferase
MKNKSYDITVFIPTWFGVKYIEELLNSVLKQKINQSFEVLVYDTSSTDGTLEVVKKFAKINKNIRWKSISKDEFGHGKTRQEAAQDAYGEVVVYLSQDALPAHDMWLHEMITTLLSFGLVASVARFGIKKRDTSVIGDDE